MFHSRDGFADEYPFESHWLDLGGVRMHYLDEGPREAEPILCVHGNPTWSFIWRRLIKSVGQVSNLPGIVKDSVIEQTRVRQVENLPHLRRVVAMDHIGCGFSDKPQDYPYRLEQHVANLRRLVETLDLKNITLVGHDWGGWIGIGGGGARAGAC